MRFTTNPPRTIENRYKAAAIKIVKKVEKSTGFDIWKAFEEFVENRFAALLIPPVRARPAW